MRIEEKEKGLEEEVIGKVCGIGKMGENMLGDRVYVEEEGEEGYGEGIGV